MNTSTQSTSIRAMLLAAAATLAMPIAGISQTEEESYLPEKYSPLRYRDIYASSAFERDILPPRPPEKEDVEKPVFEMKVVAVTGHNGRYRVTVIDKKGNYVVLTDKPNADGYYYSDIEPAAKVAEVRVKVANGGHDEWATFDENRFKVAAKGLAPKKPTNTKGRPAVVPSVRKPPPARAPIPQSKTAKAAGAKAGAEALQALQKANDDAKSRSSGRRVVLPPKSRN